MGTGKARNMVFCYCCTYTTKHSAKGIRLLLLLPLSQSPPWLSAGLFSWLPLAWLVLQVLPRPMISQCSRHRRRSLSTAASAARCTSAVAAAVAAAVPPPPPPPPLVQYSDPTDPRGF
jgi:hypothetical protein